MSAHIDASMIELGKIIDERINAPIANFFEIQNDETGDPDMSTLGENADAGSVDAAGVYTTLGSETFDMGSVEGTLRLGIWNQQTDNLVQTGAATEEGHKSAKVTMQRAVKAA